MNTVRRATHGSPHVSLGWKEVIPGSIKVVFIFIIVESVKLIPEKLLGDRGVVSIQVDGDIFHSKDNTKVIMNSATIILN